MNRTARFCSIHSHGYFVEVGCVDCKSDAKRLEWTNETETLKPARPIILSPVDAKQLAKFVKQERQRRRKLTLRIIAKHYSQESLPFMNAQFSKARDIIDRIRKTD